MLQILTQVREQLLQMPAPMPSDMMIQCCGCLRATRAVNYKMTHGVGRQHGRSALGGSAWEGQYGGVSMNGFSRTCTNCVPIWITCKPNYTR